MCEADGHVQLPLLWLARTESLFTCKACLTVALMGCPLVTLPVCELAGHGQAPATGPLCFDHVKPLTDLCLDVVLTIEQKGVLIAANGTLGWIDSVVLAASPTIVVLATSPAILALAVLAIMATIILLVVLPIFLLGAIAAAKSTVAIAVDVSAGATGIVGAVALGVIATPLLVTLFVFVL